jgi:hypothetical protein
VSSWKNKRVERMQMGLCGGQADKVGRDNEASQEDEHAKPSNN